MKSTSKYSASFTAGALYYLEFNAVLSLILDQEYSDALRNEVLENKFLAIKTEAARSRIIREMRKRMKNAPAGFWDFYSKLPETEQKLALFYLCLKTYFLIFDFHFEVTIPKWRLHASVLDKYDIQMRFDRIASSDEVVYGWAERTKEKLITQYRKILIEAGLMRNDQLIKPLSIRNEFWQYFIRLNEPWFIEACFYNSTEI